LTFSYQISNLQDFLQTMRIKRKYYNVSFAFWLNEILPVFRLEFIFFALILAKYYNPVTNAFSKLKMKP